MSIGIRYREFQQRADYQFDAAQLTAVELLAETELLLEQTDSASALPPKPVQGVYLWGSVGRGKTLLMDLFFDSLNREDKLRLHFHRFMRQVHRQLFTLSGQKNPLDRIADQLAQQYRVLCFDEFYVHDIADAMILGRLTDALYRRGMVLVITSNQHPQQLYDDGVHRDRFLPAIDNLINHNRIFHLDGGADHRLRPATREPVFFWGDEREQALQEAFIRLSGRLPKAPPRPLEINGRPIHCRAEHQGIGWFQYRDLCETPRSNQDYIELASRFHTLLLSDIPAMGSTPQGHAVTRGTEDTTINDTGNRVILNDDRTRRFISLVDELYDRSVTLFAGFLSPLSELYTQGQLDFEFQRTESRLKEMQTTLYLERPHLP